MITDTRWGYFVDVYNGKDYKVKMLSINPGRAISLQLHRHRNEHWVIVNGTAEVNLDGETLTLSKNQNIYIPVNSIHKIRNIGKINLEIIEVQTGEYLEEDDKVSLDAE